MGFSQSLQKQTALRILRMFPKEESESNFDYEDLMKMFFIITAFCLVFSSSKSLHGSPALMFSARVVFTIRTPFFRCSSSLAPRTASTIRDLVWTMTLNRDRWFDITLLSIRTSGCRARIVVFTDIKHRYHPHFARVLNMTGAEIHRQQFPLNRHSNDFVRFQWIFEFLKKDHDGIDRVFMLDAFDIFFHRDPFEVMFFENTLVLIGEGWAIGAKGNKPNRWWQDVCYGQKGNRVKNNETICAGTIFAPFHIFVRFTELLLVKWPMSHCLWDQPIGNYLFYTGELRTAGINVKVLGCLGPVLTLAACPQKVLSVGDIKEGFNGNDEIPYVVHQWKRRPQFRDMYVERCDMSAFMKQQQRLLKSNLNWLKPIRR
jgi:hypothetical protein